MLPKNLFIKLIENFGEEIVSFTDSSTVKGIFAKTGELVPSLLPYVDKGEEYLAFYTKAEDVPVGIYTYADNHYVTVATKTFDNFDNLSFTQALLRYRPIITPPEPEPEPIVYPMTLTFGNFSVDLNISEVLVKQGTLIVNVAAINKFVTDSTVGSRPVEVTVKGTVSRGDADDFVNALKNPASRFEQQLSIGGLVTIDAIVKEFQVKQTIKDEDQEFEIVFTEVRS